jgi:hypothetical protein
VFWVSLSVIESIFVRGVEVPKRVVQGRGHFLEAAHGGVSEIFALLSRVLPSDLCLKLRRHAVAAQAISGSDRVIGFTEGSRARSAPRDRRPGRRSLEGEVLAGFLAAVRRLYLDDLGYVPLPSGCAGQRGGRRVRLTVRAGGGTALTVRAAPPIQAS